MKNKKEIMLAAIDTETEGLNGAITKIGYTVDGKKVVETTPEELLPNLAGIADALNVDIYVYAHNLDFDIGKIVKAANLHFAPDKLLVINGSIARAVFMEYPHIIFCCSYKLVPSALADITDKFGLEAGKLKIDYEQFGYSSKEEYFKHAKEVDFEHFQMYWENDVKAVYQLLEAIMRENDLTKEELVRCPTAPSLAMHIFKRDCPEKMKLIAEYRTPLWLEDFYRMAYVGGRTEVFKPQFESNGNQLGYHYDVNSLYPHVMHDNVFPIGAPSVFYEGTKIRQLYEEIKAGKGDYKLGMIHAKVYAPKDIKYPVLPLRTEEKLLFPVGSFTGVWCTPELMEAEAIGYKIIEIYEGAFWKRTDYLFKDIIDKWAKIKMTSKGAKRESVKLLQNSLYGKFGMNRKRKNYKLYTAAELKKMRKKGIKCLVITMGDHEWIEYRENSHADYIHPEIAAFVTCYARLWLYRAIKIAQELKANIYYCDTDSLVIDKLLPADEVNDVLYGKFKLERTIARGIFIQPKLYAEMTIEGEFIGKSKGIVKSIKETLTYDDYIAFYKAAVDKAQVELYKGIEGRRKVMSSLKKNIDLDTPFFLSKSVDFSKQQKREILFDLNDTRPIIESDGKWYSREWNGFLKAAASMFASRYYLQKANEKHRQKGRVTSNEHREWKEEGALKYIKNCGIITRENKIIGSDEIAS
jgi:hypothetical protein